MKSHSSSAEFGNKSDSGESTPNRSPFLPKFPTDKSKSQLTETEGKASRGDKSGDEVQLQKPSWGKTKSVSPSTGSKYDDPGRSEKQNRETLSPARSSSLRSSPEESPDAHAPSQVPSWRKKLLFEQRHLESNKSSTQESDSRKPSKSMTHAQNRDVDEKKGTLKSEVKPRSAQLVNAIVQDGGSEEAGDSDYCDRGSESVDNIEIPKGNIRAKLQNLGVKQAEGTAAVRRPGRGKTQPFKSKSDAGARSLESDQQSSHSGSRGSRNRSGQSVNPGSVRVIPSRVVYPTYSTGSVKERQQKWGSLRKTSDKEDNQASSKAKPSDPLGSTTPQGTVTSGTYQLAVKSVVRADRRRHSVETYTKPLDPSAITESEEPRDFSLFMSNFDFSMQEDDIQIALAKYPDSVGVHYKTLVPETVSPQDFWLRYFYLCDEKRILRGLRRQEKLGLRASNYEVDEDDTIDSTLMTGTTAINLLPDNGLARQTSLRTKLKAWPESVSDTTESGPSILSEDPSARLVSVSKNCVSDNTSSEQPSNIVNPKQPETGLERQASFADRLKAWSKKSCDQNPKKTSDLPPTTRQRSGSTTNLPGTDLTTSDIVVSTQQFEASTKTAKEPDQGVVRNNSVRDKLKVWSQRTNEQREPGKDFSSTKLSSLATAKSFQSASKDEKITRTPIDSGPLSKIVQGMTIIKQKGGVDRAEFPLDFGDDTMSPTHRQDNRSVKSLLVDANVQLPPPSVAGNQSTSVQERMKMFSKGIPSSGGTRYPEGKTPAQHIRKKIP